jgi:cystathionine gamma-synthase
MTKSDTNNPGLDTHAIHGGSNYREETGAVIPPLFQTSTFEYGNAGGFDYTRSGNPNFRNLEAILSGIENAEHATVFGSGVSAITAVVSTLKSGDWIVAEENIYGCTYRMLDQVFEKFGVQVEYTDLTNSDNFSRITERIPQLVWLESPTNPLLKIVDIQAISDVAQEAGSTVIVDNTFASCVFQKPLELGADLSLTSTTKYTNGHSDALGGVVCSNDSEWQEKMLFAQKALGLQPSPFDTWLITRGVKTMALRMAKHHANALQFAQWLEGRAEVNWVRFPWLTSHPQHELAKTQMTGGSGIVTAEFNLSIEATRSFLETLRYFALAESLGGIESLVCHPASMTHASIPKEVRESVGLTDGVVRFSMGIENCGDLIADVETALAPR